MAPSGARVTVGAEDGALELTEQGFYDVRTQGAAADSATTLASNVDLSESNLTAMDPRELVASATGHASAQTWRVRATLVPVTKRRRRLSGSGGICLWRAGCCSRRSRCFRIASREE